MKARRLQKDRPLPLKAAPAEGVFRRKDSRFWQARFRGADGTLRRLTTSTTFRAAALEWLRCAKRTTQSPPPQNTPALTPEFPTFSATNPKATNQPT